MPNELLYPVIAFSPTGWAKEAASIADLTDASPNDDLRDWQGLVIYDAAGYRRVARRAFRLWPRSELGVRLCRLVRHSIHVGFELTEPEPAPLDELKRRVESVYGSDPSIGAAGNHRTVIEMCL